MKLIRSISVKYPYVYERHLHEKFSEYRYKGEWFKFPSEDWIIDFDNIQNIDLPEAVDLIDTMTSLLSNREYNESEMSVYEIFARRVRTARRRAGLRQGDLAKEIGITSRAIIRWESGEAERFTLDTLVSLADRFDVSLDYLLGRSDSIG